MSFSRCPPKKLKEKELFVADKSCKNTAAQGSLRPKGIYIYIFI
jgi:hypothetical protein